MILTVKGQDHEYSVVEVENSFIHIDSFPYPMEYKIIYEKEE